MKLLKKLIIVIVILSLLSITLLGCKKKEEEKKDLRFNENGNFRILQLTDIQSIDDGMTEDTRCMLSSLIDESKPDFIVLTGDNISSEYFVSKKQLLLEKYTEMADFLTSKKIYWTSTFGNHDGLMKVVTKEELLNCLMKSPYFLGGIIDNDFCKVYLNKELDTYCNYSFPLKDCSGEKVLYNLMTLDTKTPLLADYSSYNTEQINWYNSIYNENKNLKSQAADYEVENLLRNCESIGNIRVIKNIFTVTDLKYVNLLASRLTSHENVIVL
jgi:predicted MPP superfamily phosphohydrolase